jgi:hypothetical protein
LKIAERNAVQPAKVDENENENERWMKMNIGDQD